MSKCTCSNFASVLLKFRTELMTCYVTFARWQGIQHFAQSLRYLFIAGHTNRPVINFSMTLTL